MSYIAMFRPNNKLPLGVIFRQKREEKGLLVRQVAAVTELDQAIISRIENSDRIPTKEQVVKLAALYDLDLKETLSSWLAERMIRDYGDEPFASEALLEAHEKVMFSFRLKDETPSSSLTFNDTIQPDHSKPKQKRQRNKPPNP